MEIHRPSEEQLPLQENLENRRVYVIRSRNLSVGVWHAEAHGFIGVRRKFDSEYLFTEYHWDHDPHVGTVRAAKPTDTLVPEEIPLAERLGSRCENHDRLVEWRRNEPPIPAGKWFHIDDDSELEEGDFATGRSNRALFDLLKPMHDEETRLYSEANPKPDC